jgi:hypothetical protein
MNSSKFRQLELYGAKINGYLDLRESKASGSLGMESLSVGGTLDLRGVKLKGSMNMRSLDVGGQLLMNQGAQFTDVNLFGAKIGGNLDLTGSVVTGELIISRADIGNYLLMGQVTLNVVEIAGSRIGGLLDLRACKVSGLLDMDSIKLEGLLAMDGGGQFNDVNLRNAEITDNLTLSRGSTINGTKTYAKLSACNEAAVMNQCRSIALTQARRWRCSTSWAGLSRGLSSNSSSSSGSVSKSGVRSSSAK